MDKSFRDGAQNFASGYARARASSHAIPFTCYVCKKVEEGVRERFWDVLPEGWAFGRDWVWTAPGAREKPPVCPDCQDKLPLETGRLFASRGCEIWPGHS